MSFERGLISYSTSLFKRALRPGRAKSGCFIKVSSTHLETVARLIGNDIILSKK